MTTRLLIDASHQEHLRMAVINGNKLEEYDQVITERAPIKGNIYLGKITRVEPSLQAAFIDYGTNRHGFLSFTEIHPDYYKIPVADKEALLAEEEMADDDDDMGEDEELDENGESPRRGRDNEDARARRKHYSQLRHRYKIQEVIKKGQIVLVQVVKEERGLKGAALTSYISLAGRYCVLMPNTTRGGGVSRKIMNPKDRKKLKDIIASLDIPRGMGVILRTAGADRSEQEIARDFDYVSNLWDEIRENILKSHAPALINEESNLVKRAIRDYYRADIDEILVEGNDAFEQAHMTLKALIPGHIKKLKLYENSDKIPIFAQYGVDKQIQAMTDNVVQLQGGGFIVINQTEALVAIDVNSGRSTRERDIEETAVKTNCEAAEEVARQVRLRDLAGLIVVDFIDMMEKNNIRKVENRMRDALKRDRARIQVGYISPFGLLEMSRQRLRQSMVESMGSRCTHCHGTGITLNQEAISMNLIRDIQNSASYYGAGIIRIQTSPSLTSYLLSQRREKLSEIADERAVELNFDVLPIDSDERYIITHSAQKEKGENRRSNRRDQSYHDDDQHDHESGRDGDESMESPKDDNRRSNQRDNNRRGGRRDESRRDDSRRDDSRRDDSRRDDSRRDDQRRARYDHGRDEAQSDIMSADPRQDDEHYGQERDNRRSPRRDHAARDNVQREETQNTPRYARTQGTGNERNRHQRHAVVETPDDDTINAVNLPNEPAHNEQTAPTQRGRGRPKRVKNEDMDVINIANPVHEASADEVNINADIAPENPSGEAPKKRGRRKASENIIAPSQLEPSMDSESVKTNAPVIGNEFSDPDDIPLPPKRERLKLKAWR